MYDVQQALKDISSIYPPFSKFEDTAGTGQCLLLEIIKELGIEQSLTEKAILLLGSANRETQDTL